MLSKTNGIVRLDYFDIVEYEGNIGIIVEAKYPPNCYANQYSVRWYDRKPNTRCAWFGDGELKLVMKFSHIDMP